LSPGNLCRSIQDYRGVPPTSAWTLAIPWSLAKIKPRGQKAMRRLDRRVPGGRAPHSRASGFRSFEAFRGCRLGLCPACCCGPRSRLAGQRPLPFLLYRRDLPADLQERMAGTRSGPACGRSCGRAQQIAGGAMETGAVDWPCAQLHRATQSRPRRPDQADNPWLLR
jgi:hypothetical protein